MRNKRRMYNNTINTDGKLARAFGAHEFPAGVRHKRALLNLVLARQATHEIGIFEVAV